jgi:hypothetical protein
MRALLALLTLSALSLPTLSHADDLEVAFGEEFGHLEYWRDAAIVNMPEQTFGAGLLLTEPNDTMGYATLLTRVLEGYEPLDIRVGGRVVLVGLNDPDNDVIGIAFGATGRYRLPLDWFPGLRRYPVHVGARIFYAPETTTSDSGVDVLDVDIIRGEIELSPRLMGIVGVRKVSVDRRVGEDDIVDEKLYVGLRLEL